jgi:hypothetical protein
MRHWGTKTRLIQTIGICVTAAFLLAAESAETLPARQPSLGISMACKTSAGGRGIIRGFASVTLSNLTTSTIPKGQMLFAKKGGKTIRFRVVEPIPQGGSATYRTIARAFQAEGDCEGWY